MVSFTSISGGDTVFNHTLGSTPGMVIFKATDVTESWTVWHRYNTNKVGVLNSTNAFSTDNGWATAYNAPQNQDNFLLKLR